MKAHVKRWLAILLSLICFYYLMLFCDAQTDGFSVARIHSDLSFHPEWEPAETQSKEILDPIVGQTFHYLACGGQCFAFISEDRRYVIKFFKHKLRHPLSTFLKMHLPYPWEQKRLKKLNKALFKLNRDFTSYKIAYEDLREETGLIFLHLNKGGNLNRSITIIDKLGISHTIALNDVEFVVQQRAELVYSYFNRLVKHDDLASIKAAMQSLFSLIVSREQKGIFDEDARLYRNFGFIDERPIFIDVGRFRRDLRYQDPILYKKDLEDIIGHFRDWLEETHPTLVPTLDTELNAFKTRC